MTTKTEAASQVRTVLQAVKDLLAQPGGAKLNEASTRAHFINPLLNALGYSGLDDLEFEHYLPDGKTFLDYRLYVDGVARVAVEAKSLDVSLTDKEGAQGVSYASVLGDEWTVLTNARQWRLYHTFAQAPLAGKLVIDLDLTKWATDSEFDRIFDQLWLVSREAFASGGGPDVWLTGQKLDHHLRHVMQDPGSLEVKYVRKQLEANGISVGGDDVAAWFKQHLSDSLVASAPRGHKAADVGTPEAKVSSPLAEYSPTQAPKYWVVPAGRQEGYSAEEHLDAWLQRGFWGFGSSTAGRKAMRPGDWACFYAAKSKQIVAFGRIDGDLEHHVGPNEWPGPGPFDGSVYKVPLTDITWLDPRPVLDASLRAQLDAFKDKPVGNGWSWLVQTTHRLTQDDFARLTGGAAKVPSI
jgi:Type I restriction enzyme R protein N terminus (HSDR_N)